VTALTYSDSVSNGCGGTKVVSRTWTATDQCGNSTNRVQTITVRDNAPPTITYVSVDTLGKDSYAGNSDAPQVAQSSFATVFPTGLVIGLSNAIAIIAGHDRLLWEANTAGQTALAAVLAQSGGTSGPITQDVVNPTDTFGGGDLTLQTITLTLNVGFNQAGVIGAGPNNFGSLVYNNTNGSDPLRGMTVSQILAAANGALAGQGLPAGYDFAGATGSSLALTSLQFSNAGSYTVVVSNSAVSVTNQAAVLNVAPILAVQVGGQGLTLTWPGSFVLQAAPKPAGPYADIPGATSPYSYNTQTNAQQFFRLRSQPSP